jgi:hypothetical protein
MRAHYEPGLPACDPVRGPVHVRDNPPAVCSPNKICGHRDGATTFVCCDPSIECGRCVE